ncbi:hypothetical protein MPLDJ20_260111 [Mesorhizobium plurifarium]|uniref:Uncharacterized protein n=1 Tax=Mesorhizobium plurifarium TaxID=69974 RepID=A0A090FDM0_MESPL|nr:hypothetical protein MPLDJ20_260111 [Mesorhizobium plurifarium]
MTVGSTNWQRPIILRSGEPASSDANALRHSLKDAKVAFAVSTGLQMDASPGLHESKTITAAVAASIRNSLCWRSQRRQNRFVSYLLKYIIALTPGFRAFLLGCGQRDGLPTPVSNNEQECWAIRLGAILPFQDSGWAERGPRFFWPLHQMQ